MQIAAKLAPAPPQQPVAAPKAAPAPSKVAAAPKAAAKPPVEKEPAEEAPKNVSVQVTQTHERLASWGVGFLQAPGFLASLAGVLGKPITVEATKLQVCTCCMYCMKEAVTLLPYLPGKVCPPYFWCTDGSRWVHPQKLLPCVTQVEPKPDEARPAPAPPAPMPPPTPPPPPPPAPAVKPAAAAVAEPTPAPKPAPKPAVSRARKVSSKKGTCGAHGLGAAVPSTHPALRRLALNLTRADAS